MPDDPTTVSDKRLQHLAGVINIDAAWHGIGTTEIQAIAAELLELRRRHSEREQPQGEPEAIHPRILNMITERKELGVERDLLIKLIERLKYLEQQHAGRRDEVDEQMPLVKLSGGWAVDPTPGNYRIIDENGAEVHHSKTPTMTLAGFAFTLQKFRATVAEFDKYADDPDVVRAIGMAKVRQSALPLPPSGATAGEDAK